MSAKPIVAATDGSEESLRAVGWAAREAVLRGVPLRLVSAAALLPRMIGGHASVVAVHAWHTPQLDISRAGHAPAEPAAYVFQTEAARELEALLDTWREKYPDVPVGQDVVHGHPGRALAGLSARADLVVLGRHAAHHGPGAVIHAVLSHAHGPVVTVPSASD